MSLMTIIPMPFTPLYSGARVLDDHHTAPEHHALPSPQPRPPPRPAPEPSSHPTAPPGHALDHARPGSAAATRRSHRCQVPHDIDVAQTLPISSPCAKPSR